MIEELSGGKCCRRMLVGRGNCAAVVYCVSSGKDRSFFGSRVLQDVSEKDCD